MLPIDTTESVNVLIEGQTILLPKNIAANDETLKRALAPFYPGVSNSTIKRDEKTGKIEIIKRAGTKGGLYSRKVTITLPFLAGYQVSHNCSRVGYSRKGRAGVCQGRKLSRPCHVLRPNLQRLRGSRAEYPPGDRSIPSCSMIPCSPR